MDLQLDNSLGELYNSNSQKIRVITENWFGNNSFCPYCGNEQISSFENNRPVADFYCSNCNNQFELKSKSGKLHEKITDGAYKTMIERITSNENPDLFCLSYSKTSYHINNLIFIPKYFFTTNIIERRKPLSPTARRSGWVGCNIKIGEVPQEGKIKIISDGIPINKNIVIEQTKKTLLLNTDNLMARGWLLDILLCLNKIKNNDFSLREFYNFENELSAKHQENNNIRPKIRQQLQILRDKGFIEFLGNGNYRKRL